MQIWKLLACGLVLLSPMIGCEKEEPTKVSTPPAAPTPFPATATPSAPVEAPTEVAVTPTTAPARVFPEDLTVDAEREPAIRAKAKELNASPVVDMKGLKPGDVRIFLVRGDKGGGSIYGSGPYTLDSQLRRAVVHAGAVKDKELGIVRVKVIKHLDAHPSVAAHGITPTAWGLYHTSYTIEAIPVP